MSFIERDLPIVNIIYKNSAASWRNLSSKIKNKAIAPTLTIQAFAEYSSQSRKTYRF